MPERTSNQLPPKFWVRARRVTCSPGSFHKIQIKAKGKDRATASNATYATNISDLGFEWSTGSTGVDTAAPAEKAHRWSRRYRPESEADVPTVTPAHKAHQVPKIRYFLVFDLEGKYEIIEFPVLLFDAVAGCEIGRFQKFVSPKDLFKGCPLTDTPAEPFPAVLEEFNSWLKKMVGKGLREMGTDSSDMVFVTCGDWDCKHVKTQCKIWDVPTPWAFSRWINIKRSYHDHYGGEFRGMKSMNLGSSDTVVLSMCGYSPGVTVLLLSPTCF